MMFLFCATSASVILKGLLLAEMLLPCLFCLRRAEQVQLSVKTLSPVYHEIHRAGNCYKFAIDAYFPESPALTMTETSSSPSWYLL